MALELGAPAVIAVAVCEVTGTSKVPLPAYADKSELFVSVVLFCELRLPLVCELLPGTALAAVTTTGTDGIGTEKPSSGPKDSIAEAVP